MTGARLAAAGRLERVPRAPRSRGATARSPARRPPSPRSRLRLLLLLLPLSALSTLSALSGQAAAQLGEPRTAERRIPISRLPLRIERPGSYYVTTTLVGDEGITISSSDVTLDLDGHALVGVEAGGSGITVDVDRDNVVVQNGTVRDWGGHGVDAVRAFHSRLRDLHATSNRGHGLLIGRESAVTDCSSRFNGGVGIVAGAHTTVSDGLVVFNGASGIQVDEGARVLRNTCQNNGYQRGSGAGVLALGDENRIEANEVSDNDVGLEIRGRDNVVAGNEVRRNADNYAIERGNVLHIVLGQVPELVEWPATVTLTGPLTGVAGDHGLRIRSSDVTVDLGGHALIGLTGSHDGIHVEPGYANIAVVNGALRDWDGHGVMAAGAAGNVELRDVLCSNNGQYGAWLGDGSTGVDCRAVRNGRRAGGTERTPLEGGGLRLGSDGTLRGCTALANVGVGLAAGRGSTLTACVARTNEGDGIAAGDGSQVLGCTASFNGGDGIDVGSRCTVRDGSASENAGDGVRAVDGCRIVAVDAAGNGEDAGGAGVHLVGDRNRVEDNSVSGNFAGIVADGTGNLVLRNSAAGNQVDFAVADGNALGRVIDVTGGASLPPGDPWANFVH